MILLNSLPDEYLVVKNALQYSGTVPSVDLIVFGLKSRELELKIQKHNGSNLFVKGKVKVGQSSKDNGKTHQRNVGFKNNKNSKGNSRTNGESKKCFFPNKVGHLKKNCYDWIKSTNRIVQRQT